MFTDHHVYDEPGVSIYDTHELIARIEELEAQIVDGLLEDDDDEITAVRDLLTELGG